MVSMRTARVAAMASALALSVAGVPVLADPGGGNQYGWCQGVGNRHHTTGCASVPNVDPIPAQPDPVVNTVDTGPPDYPVPPLPPDPPLRASDPVPQPIRQETPIPVPRLPDAPLLTTQIPPPQLPQATPNIVPPRLNEPGQAVVTPPPQLPQATPNLVPPRLNEPGQAVVTSPPQLPQATPNLVPPQQPPRASSVPPQVPQAMPVLLPPQQPANPTRLATQGPQTVPGFVPPQTNVPNVTIGSALVPLTSSVLTPDMHGPHPLDPSNLIVPRPGRQVVGNLQRLEHAIGMNEAHYVCLASGLGRRRFKDDEHEVGLVPGFHLTDALTRSVPLDRHLYPGCFIAVERRWHRDHG